MPSVAIPAPFHSHPIGGIPHRHPRPPRPTPNADPRSPHWPDCLTAAVGPPLPQAAAAQALTAQDCEPRRAPVDGTAGPPALRTGQSGCPMAGVLALCRRWRLRRRLRLGAVAVPFFKWQIILVMAFFNAGLVELSCFLQLEKAIFYAFLRNRKGSCAKLFAFAKV